MSHRRFATALALALALTLAACGSDDGGCSGATCPDSRLRGRLYVVNGARELGAFQVWVDSQLVWGRVEAGSSTGTVWLQPGQHTVALVKATPPTSVEEIGVDLREDAPRLVVGLNLGGDLGALVVNDTGSTVPAGATKLRVVHAATGAPAVDVWTSQMTESLSPQRVMTPFPYGVASPYVQKAPGRWVVTVTARDDAAPAPGTALATTTVDLAAGQRASVVLVAGRTAGSMELVTVRER